MMLNIFGREISPYAITFIMSFVISYALVYILLKKKDIPANIIGYSIITNFVFCIYGSKMYGVILSGFKENIFNSGFASLGGAIGLLTGIFIITCIYKEKKNYLWQAYLAVLPLFYGVSKIGCHIMGCCHGRPYEGPFSISYNNEFFHTGNIFPVQITESIVFIFIFCVTILTYLRNDKYVIGMAFILCGLGKFSLDFLREEHIGKILSANQIISIIFMILGIYITVKSHRKFKDFSVKVS